MGDIVSTPDDSDQQCGYESDEIINHFTIHRKCDILPIIDTRLQNYIKQPAIRMVETKSRSKLTINIKKKKIIYAEIVKL